MTRTTISIASSINQTCNAEALAPTARWALASLALAMLLASLGSSIANVSLPTLALAFGASFQQLQWVVLAYLLAITTLIVSAGRLGDMLGRRRLLLFGLFLFTLAAILCAIVPTLSLLIAARAIQGFGAAMMMALSVALIGETVAKEKTGSAMGLLGTMSAVGTALGPSLGGILIAGWGWPAIFLVSVPLGMLAFLLVYRFLPLDQPKKQIDFDWLGTLLLALTLGAYALAMTLGRGHFGLLNFALLLATAVGIGLFILAEKKVASPLIRFSLFRDVALSASLSMSALVATVMMTTLVVGPFYLARAFGLDVVQVGFVLSIGPMVAAIAGVPAGRVVDRLGAPRMTIVGLIGIALGCMALALMPAAFGLLGYLLPITLMTSSYALFMVANNTAMMRDIHAEQRGVVSGMLSLSRNLGLITGVSLMGAVFTYASKDINTATPAAMASGMHLTFFIAATLILMALAIAVMVYRRDDA